MSSLDQAIKETEEILLSKGRMLATMHLKNKYNFSLPEANKIVQELSSKLMKEGKIIAHLPGTRVNFPFVIFGSIFLFFGLPMLVAATLIYVSNERDYESRIKVLGEVISLDGYDSYTPIVSYEWEGVFYEARGQVASNPPAFEIGEEVNVLVNPNDPSAAVIDSFVERWLIVLILGFMGLIFSSIGLGAVLHKPLGKLLSPNKQIL